jgi:hypothetical protein
VAEGPLGVVVGGVVVGGVVVGGLDARVVVGAVVWLLAGDGGGLVWAEHTVVARARSALVVVRSESAWRTVARRSFWAAVMEAVEPEPACDEPGDLLPVAVLPVAVLPVAVLPVAVLPVAVLPVAVLPVAVLPFVALAVLVVPLPAAAFVPVLVPVPEAAETWPDSAWVRVSSALATWPWADARAYFREVVSKVARTWPAVTLSPIATGTVATIPDVAKDTVAALEGSVVPVACNVCTTGYEPTLAVTYVGAVPRDVA